MDIADAVH